MTTLSKLKFEPTLAGMNARVEFGNMFVSVGYSIPGLDAALETNSSIGQYKGDGRGTWEVAYGVLGSPEMVIVITFATRRQVNTVLRNIRLKGSMANAALKQVDSCVNNTCSPGGTHLQTCRNAAGSVMSVERIRPTRRFRQYEAYAVWAAASLDGTPVQALCIEAREGDEHPFYFGVASTGARLTIEQVAGGWKIELAVPSNGLEASTESRLTPFEPAEYTLCAHGFREVAR